ncbi:MAG: bifunctional diaminohydroxyphosphoribosylaminopyrimidine deaminase/5-amino-6-(5-phosphoribosylamino)uracil reductase RibD [Candidatus Nanopelagicales bacterium]|nr:bifunctional diaminohydroxyphosphoribosylaminopyrimidine deaminase/5-amino-6-(5-phosphoribosylamino)uracil reductase RibD [Candidatus Nanopelagicales bacterium]MCU0298980.1 bifunctional diaminohydroxyphosphoribosylaminopyrimidine deaminase/5-amino-6-(5-phosphoribosylamino)uracil reductase RibD [Candidatus Nanopelagicales bacterium]
MDTELMAQALACAASVHGRVGPNPRVGAVLVDDSGQVVATGAHEGAGTPHAEVVALSRAGERARGTTAYVTLEPCNHHGLTPPCAQALLAAGVDRVHYAVADPTPVAGGGAQFLRDHGVEVTLGPLTDEAARFLEPWLFAVTHGRPFVTYKVASTIDGYIAAADGSSRWITGEQARAWVHRLRATVDAVAVGSGTYRQDSPQLTVRGLDVVKQPLRVVLGHVQDDDFVVIAERDPRLALNHLYEQGVRHVLLEGGATVGAAFLAADLVDELIWLTAPKLFGAGTRAVGDLGIETISQAQTWRRDHLSSLGMDVMTRYRRV